jgi:hypothetical protein
MMTLEDAEEMAVGMYVRARLDPERPAPPAKLCAALFGTKPSRVADLPRESVMGLVHGEVRIYVRSSVVPERARWLTCHEIGHAEVRRWCGGGEALERSMDLLGACLACPRPAFERLVRRLGHSVYDLAHASATTHALAMLRLGEVTGRPVRLLGQRERERGEAFAWGDVRRALSGRERHRVHPIRLADEKKWGLMAV